MTMHLVLPQCTCGAWANLPALRSHPEWTGRLPGETLGDWMQRHAVLTGHTRDCAISAWCRDGIGTCGLCGAPECGCAR